MPPHFACCAKPGTGRVPGGDTGPAHGSQLHQPRVRDGERGCSLQSGHLAWCSLAVEAGTAWAGRAGQSLCCCLCHLGFICHLCLAFAPLLLRMAWPHSCPPRLWSQPSCACATPPSLKAFLPGAKRCLRCSGSCSSSLVSEQSVFPEKKTSGISLDFREESVLCQAGPWHCIPVAASASGRGVSSSAHFSPIPVAFKAALAVTETSLVPALQNHSLYFEQDP